MTHGVVPSDVEYAQQLMDAGCTDSAIVAGLCSRGVGPEQAAELLDRLRDGGAVALAFPVLHSPSASRGKGAPGHLRHRSQAHRTHAGSFDSDSKDRTGGLVFCFLLLVGLLWFWLTDFGPIRTPSDNSFIQTDDFEQRAHTLTNFPSR